MMPTDLAPLRPPEPEPEPVDGATRDDLAHLSAIIATQSEIARAGLDLDVVTDLVARLSLDLTRADGAAVGLIEGGVLVRRAAVGPLAADLGAGMPIGPDLPGPGLRPGEVLRCEDAEADPRVDREACRRAGVRSLVAVPLNHGGAAVGVLAVLAAGPRRFAGREVRTLQVLAGLSGAAMDQAAESAGKQALLAERTAALEALRASEERFRAFMDNGPVVAFMKDDEGRYLYVNAPWERLFRIGRAELRGRTDFDWLPEPVARQLRANDLAALGSGRVIETIESVPTPEGEMRDWLVYKFPIADRDGRRVRGGWGGVGIDVSERKALELRLADQLRHAKELNVELERRRREAEQANCLLAELATTDGLTGLRNVRHFRESLDDAFALAARHGQPLSLILLDVDHFKPYNDTFGHPAGDEVLCTLAGTPRRGLRSHDIAARYGGEEFVVLLPAAGARAALAVAERLRATIAAHPWPRRPVTASLGVATAAPDTPNPAALIEQADQALYQSKQRGRDRVTHHRDMATDG